MFIAKFRNFSQNTTFHGFHQLAESQRWWKRFSWFAIIATCTGIFCLQAYKQLGQYLDGRPSTIIGVLNDEEYHPPSVYICIRKWFWIDWSKLQLYNISKEELMGAKSYLYPVYQYYSETPVEETKRRFQHKMQEMNRSDVVDFLSILATDSYDASNYSGRVRMQKHFADHAVYFILNSSMAQENDFNGRMEFRIVFNFSTYWANVISRLGSGEYGPNDQSDTSEATLRTAYPPLLGVSDLSQSVEVEPGPRYQIYADTRLQRRLRNCRTNNTMARRLWYTPSLCALECELEANVSVNASSCYDYSVAMRLDPASAVRDRMRPLCSLGFHINGSAEAEGLDKPSLRNLSETEERERKARIEQCQRNCLPLCDKYTTTLSVIIQQVSKPANWSTIDIRYPEAQSVSVVEEIYQYGWLDLLSDIGGLLGLWLGGSIISIFEIIHYFCCALPPHESRIGQTSHVTKPALAVDEKRVRDIRVDPAGTKDSSESGSGSGRLTIRRSGSVVRNK